MRSGERPNLLELFTPHRTGGDYPGAVMTREEQVKAVGLEAGARGVGIAAAEAFRGKGPRGYRPGGILPGARSAVVARGGGPAARAWRCPAHRVVGLPGC